MCQRVSTVQRIATGGTGIGDALFQRGVGRHWPAGLRWPLASANDGMSATAAPDLLGSQALWGGVLEALLALAFVVKLRRRQLVL